jgi:AcrR family transcriptional regulator
MEKRSPGRPRVFDREAVLEKAMRLFWDRGYEGTSFDELISVMGISPSSFYSAFQSKENLFYEAAEHYLSGPGGYLSSPLEASVQTRTAVENLLEKAAIAATNENLPSGCMIALAGAHVPPSLNSLRNEMRARRNWVETELTTRINAGIKAGDVPYDADPEELAAFFASVIRGIAILARDGASRDKLIKISRAAMRAWPA